MNNQEIERALTGYRICKQMFVGVFSADNLPVKEYSGAYVSNTDMSTQSGRHWVAFFTPVPGQVDFFDSFGREPSSYSPHLVEWIGKDKAKSSKKIFQTDNSVVCGNYCILFLLSRSHKIPFDDIISILSKNKNINDRFVHKFVNEYFNMKTKLTDREFSSSQFARTT